VRRDQLVHRGEDLLQGRGEVAFFGQVAEKLFGQEALTGRELHELELLA
jgi:hypothetical protein